MSDPQQIEVKVFLDSVDPVRFRLESPLPKGTKDNDFIFKNDGHPGFYLSYVLQSDGHGADYSFPDELDDALYSAKSTTCPTKKGQWPQFRAHEVKPGNKILVVRNLNQHQAQFSYTLRVTRRPHDPDPECLDLDPGGVNENGSYRSSFDTYVTYGALAVGALVAIVIVTEALHITSFFAR
jgi:hypothetical protein